MNKIEYSSITEIVPTSVLMDILKNKLEPLSNLLEPCDIERLINAGYMDAPASRDYHENYSGGLFDHSCKVANALVKLTEDNHLQWGRKESPYIVGMFHDLCKLDQYKLTDCESGFSEFVHNEDVLYKGHGDKSVMIASTYVKLTEEEIACIRYHMGAFTEKEEWKYYTKALKEFPNVLWTHQADMIAAHLI